MGKLGTVECPKCRGFGFDPMGFLGGVSMTSAHCRRCGGRGYVSGCGCYAAVLAAILLLPPGVALAAWVL